MTVPDAYTEETLAAYMLEMLGATATALSWTADNLSEAINDALLLYGVSAIGDASDIEKLRDCARVAAWQAVVDWTTGNYSLALGTTRLSREQFHEQAVGQLKRSRVKALKHGVDAAVGVLRVRRRDDPYAYLSDEDRMRAR